MVFQQAQLKSWLWMKHKVHRFNYSFVDWVLNPMYCIKIYNISNGEFKGITGTGKEGGFW